MTKTKMPALEESARGRATRSKTAWDQKSTAHRERTATRPRASRVDFPSPSFRRFLGWLAGLAHAVGMRWSGRSEAA